MKIQHLNPDTLHKNPAFSQAVLAEGTKTLYIGGQNGRSTDGSLVSTEFVPQVRQTYMNILAALKAAGATQENVVKLTIYTVTGTSLQDGLTVAQEVWGPHSTAITVVSVDGLGEPGQGVLVEIDAIAVL